MVTVVSQKVIVKNDVEICYSYAGKSRISIVYFHLTFTRKTVNYNRLNPENYQEISFSTGSHLFDNNAGA